MNLITSYKNNGFESVADGVMSFFDRRSDLHRNDIPQVMGQRIMQNQQKFLLTSVLQKSIVLNQKHLPYLKSLSEESVLGFKSTSKNVLSLANIVQKNRYLLIRFLTYSVMRLECVLRNGTLTGLSAKKQLNQFIKFTLKQLRLD